MVRHLGTKRKTGVKRTEGERWDTGSKYISGSSSFILNAGRQPLQDCRTSKQAKKLPRVCALRFLGELIHAYASRLLLEGGEGVTEDGVGIRAGDLDGLDLDALLVLHAVGLGAGVVGVLVGGAAAVVEHGDDGGTARLVHGHVEGSGAGAHAREGGGEGGGGSDEGGEGNGAHL